jgi:hypothetical protein
VKCRPMDIKRDAKPEIVPVLPRFKNLKQDSVKRKSFYALEPLSFAVSQNRFSNSRKIQFPRIKVQ